VSLSLIISWACTGTSAETRTEAPGTEGDGDYQVGPDYKIDPDLADQGNSKGKSFEFSMPLAESKIFQGDDPMLQPEKKPVRKDRMINVYVPAAYKDGDKAPLLIIHDGPGQLNLVRNALDNHRFVFSLSTSHCDKRVFEQTLADTLVWLWRGHQPD
jgi:hypothetical protein